MSISPVVLSPTTMAGRYTVQGTLQSLRTIFSLSCLVWKYGWSRPSASSNMSSRNTPSYRPAAAMEETW
ncbi:hypothetical protein D3C71_1691010 [compost metagenome]